MDGRWGERLLVRLPVGWKEAVNGRKWKIRVEMTNNQAEMKHSLFTVFLFPS